MTSGRRSIGHAAAGCLLVLPLLTGCVPEDQRTETLDMQGPATRAQLAPEMVAALDSGSAAYRAEAYDAALEQYRLATELEPDQASGWFGLYMVHSALGNADEAEAALERVRELAPGASIVHPQPEDTL